MSLVLAIEPDAGQARQLAHIVQQLRAELVVVKTTGEVFIALDGRAPDLVLVPALLSPKEETTLAEALRAVAGDAPVRLLTKPVLSTAHAQAHVADGLMANLRKKKKKPSPVPDGCDPATFAEQMAVYLGEAGKPAPPAPEIVAPPPTALAKAAPPPAVESPLSVKAAPAKEPVPLVKSAPAKAPVPSVKRAPRAEPWPLAASSLVTEPPSPAEPLSIAAEPPVWTSLESLFINAAEHSPVQDPPPSPELAPLADPLFSTAAEPPAWPSLESLFINAAGHPPVQDPPPAPEAAPLADPVFSTAAEPPAWPSLESLFVNAVEHPPVQELPRSTEPEAAPSWRSHVSQPDASFDIGVAVAPKEIVATPEGAVVAAPKERVGTVPVPAAATGSDEREWRGLPDEREWRDLVASFQRAVGALEIEKWLAFRAEPAATQAVQPAKSAGEPCDEWGFYDPAQYGLSAVLNKIDRMDGPNKHTR